MKHSTRLYAIAVVMAVIQIFDPGGLTFAFWALLCLVGARLCEGAEEYEESQRK